MLSFVRAEAEIDGHFQGGKFERVHCYPLKTIYDLSIIAGLKSCRKRGLGGKNENGCSQFF